MGTEVSGLCEWLGRCGLRRKTGRGAMVAWLGSIEFIEFMERIEIQTLSFSVSAALQLVFSNIGGVFDGPVSIHKAPPFIFSN